MINWNDPKSKISRFFTVGEALYLPSWHVYHIPSEEEKTNIITLAEQIDRVREFVGAPIETHVWIRPLKVNTKGTIKCVISNDPNKKDIETIALKTLNYNLFIGSRAPNGAHPKGRAIDFNVKGYTTTEQNDIIKHKLLPHLKEWNLRLENIRGNWIHMDNFTPNGERRFFIP